MSLRRTERATQLTLRQRLPTSVRDAAAAEGLTVRVLRGRRAGAGRAVRVPAAAARPPHRHRGLADHHHAALARRPHRHASAEAPG